MFKSEALRKNPNAYEEAALPNIYDGARDNEKFPDAFVAHVIKVLPLIREVLVISW